MLKNEGIGLTKRREMSYKKENSIRANTQGPHPGIRGVEEGLSARDELIQRLHRFRTSKIPNLTGRKFPFTSWG